MTPGGEGEADLVGGGDGFRVESGSEAELGSGVFGAFDLIVVEQGSGADEDFRESFRDAADGFFGGGGAEGDFHDVEAAGEQGFGEGFGGFDVVEHDDGDDAFGEDAFDHGGSVGRGKRRAGQLWRVLAGGPGCRDQFGFGLSWERR